jgi:hypothetical protein
MDSMIISVETMCKQNEVSIKKFKITVDDNGINTTTEVTD